MTTDQPPVDTATIVQAAREVLEREAQALAALVGQVDASFAAVVRAVLATPGKVVTTGTGTSGIWLNAWPTCLPFAARPLFFLPCLDALHGGMAAIAASDLVIALSKGQRWQATAGFWSGPSATSPWSSSTYLSPSLMRCWCAAQWWASVAQTSTPLTTGIRSSTSDAART